MAVTLPTALITKAEAISLAWTNAGDERLISDSAILAAQFENIRPALGEDLYDEIVSQAPSSYNAGNQILIDNFVKKALAHFVKEAVAQDMVINSGSNGLQVTNTEYSRGATVDEVAQIRKKARAQANSLLNEMIRYIEDNTDVYTLYVAGSKPNEVRGGGFVIH